MTPDPHRFSGFQRIPASPNRHRYGALLDKKPRHSSMFIMNHRMQSIPVLPALGVDIGALLGKKPHYRFLPFTSSCVQSISISSALGIGVGVLLNK